MEEKGERIPKLGEIVLFRTGGAGELGNNNAKVVPAIVTRVWGATCVNLRVLTDGNATPWLTSVLYSENGEYGHNWYYPPA